jgi:hypothetical protein
MFDERDSVALVFSEIFSPSLARLELDKEEEEEETSFDVETEGSLLRS